MFYAAVHFVEAYFADQGQHLVSHETRGNYVARDAKLRPIYKDYEDLKFYGFNARYEMMGFTRQDVKDALPKAQAIKSHIQRLV